MITPGNTLENSTKATAIYFNVPLCSIGAGETTHKQAKHKSKQKLTTIKESFAKTQQSVATTAM